MSKYEFIKYGDNYIIKNSRGRVVSEKEKLQLENDELVLEDLKSCDCQKETTKKISKNKKRIKEIEEEEKKEIKKSEEIKEIDEIEENTAFDEKEDAEDEIIKETD